MFADFWTDSKDKVLSCLLRKLEKSHLANKASFFVGGKSIKYSLETVSGIKLNLNTV